LHYSRRSAETFLALVRKGSNGGAAGGILHICLSDAVAAPLLHAGFEVKVAAHPNEDALFALLG
jgi:uroporphyrinogen-III synthase